MLLPFPIGTLQCGNPIGCLRTIELSAATVFCGQCQQRSTRDLRTLQGTARSYREQGFAKKKNVNLHTDTPPLHLWSIPCYPLKKFSRQPFTFKKPKKLKNKITQNHHFTSHDFGFPRFHDFFGWKNLFSSEDSESKMRFRGRRVVEVPEANLGRNLGRKPKTPWWFGWRAPCLRTLQVLSPKLEGAWIHLPSMEAFGRRVGELLVSRRGFLSEDVESMRPFLLEFASIRWKMMIFCHGQPSLTVNQNIGSNLHPIICQFSLGGDSSGYTVVQTSFNCLKRKCCDTLLHEGNVAMWPGWFEFQHKPIHINQLSVLLM